MRVGSLTLSVRSVHEKGAAKLVIRPAAVELHATAVPGSLPAEIRKATYLGSHWDYWLSAEIGDLFVTQEIGLNHPAGQHVYLTLKPERLAIV